MGSADAVRPPTASVEMVVEDRADRAVGPRADLERAAAGGVDPFPAKALDQADDAQTGAEPLLGMRPVGEDFLDKQRSVGSRSRRPPG